MADPADDGDRVGLEPHARTPPVPETAPGELGVDGVDRDGEPGGEALDDDDEGLAVGLSGGQVAQHRANLPGGPAGPEARCRVSPG